MTNLFLASLIHPLQSVVRRCSVTKRCFEKFRKIHRKAPVLGSLFNKVAGLRPEAFTVYLRVTAAVHPLTQARENLNIGFISLQNLSPISMTSAILVTSTTLI